MTGGAIGLLAALFLLFAAVAGIPMLWERYRKRSALAHVAKRFTDAVIDNDRGTVAGSFDGRPVRCALTSRGDGSSAVSYTEVSVGMSGPSIQLELRPQSLAETIDVRRGLAVDVTTGDAAFDRAFIVEGAPADAVRQVLEDTMLRASILALGKIEVTQQPGTLIFARPGWVWGAELITMADVAGTLAASLAAVGARTGPSHAGSYRSQPDAGHGAELDALEEVRARRGRKMRTRSIVLLAAALLFVAFWTAGVFWPR